jgi:hypothetical protein
MGAHRGSVPPAGSRVGILDRVSMTGNYDEAPDIGEQHHDS